MKKIMNAWLFLSVLVMAFSSVIAQTPFAKYFTIAGSSVFTPCNMGQLPGGGYFVVGNANMFDHNEFMVWTLNGKGDSLKVKKYFPKTPYSQNNRWAIDAASSSDGGLFILTLLKDFTGLGWYAVMRTNAQGDSSWCVNVSTPWPSGSVNSIIATSDGGCIVAGQKWHTNYPWLVKISSTGTVSWEALIDSEGSGRYFTSVCQTSDGGYIAVTNGQIDFIFTRNLLVAKFSSTGAVLWYKTFYSGFLDKGDLRIAEGNSVVATSDGGAMITGKVTDPGVWASKPIIMRINAFGDSLWTKKYYPWKGPTDAGNATKVVRLPSDQYLIFLKKNTTTVPENTIIKVNSSGDSLWTQVGYGAGIGNMVGTDSEGGILLIGNATGANFFDNVAVFIRTTSGGLYKSPELMTPTNGYTGINMIPTLEWRGSPWSGGPFHKPSSFRVQVARDSAFTNIVFDRSNVTATTQQVTQLLPGTKYFWRVQSFGKEGSPTNWSFVYRFTTTGTPVSTVQAIAYDNTEPVGVYVLSVGDTCAVRFDGINGTHLDSIRVALRNTASMQGGVWRAATSGSSLLANKLAGPFTVVGKTTPSATNPAPYVYPNPYPNWVKYDLRSLNIDASTNFVVGFIIDGVYVNSSSPTNRVMYTSVPGTAAYHSYTYLHSPSSGTPGWYYIGDGTNISLYLIRAYVSSGATGVNEPIELLPSSFSLEQNYPNPFNPSTEISWQLAVGSMVTLKISDILGREVATLVNEFKQAGKYVTTFHGTSLPSGVYFYTLIAENKIETKKMLLIK